MIDRQIKNQPANMPQNIQSQKPIYQSCASYVRDYCKRKKIKQSQIVEQGVMDKSTVSRIFRNNNGRKGPIQMTYDQLCRFAIVTQMPGEDFEVGCILISPLRKFIGNIEVENVITANIILEKEGHIIPDK